MFSMSYCWACRSTHTMPMMSLRRRDKLCAAPSGTYPSSSMACWTRVLVASRTRSWPCTTPDIEGSHKRHVNVYTGNLSAYTNPQHRAGQGPCPRRNKGEVDDGTGDGRGRRPRLPGRFHLGSV